MNGAGPTGPFGAAGGSAGPSLDDTSNSGSFYIQAMAMIENKRVRLGEPLTLDDVAERLAWTDDDVAAHRVERQRWASETVDRLKSHSLPRET